MYLWVYAANLNAIKFYEHLDGINVEIVEKQLEDGNKALVCRYFWNDVSGLVSLPSFQPQNRRELRN